MGYEDEKRAINEEGWEGNAAVLIGKEKELEVLRERLEKEGKTEDLGTYIKLHKEVLLSKDDPEMAELKDTTEGAKGLVFEKYFGKPDSSSIRYVDREGNIAGVNIDAGKIAVYRKLAEDFLKLEQGGVGGGSEGYNLCERLRQVLQSDLEKIGFSGEDISLSDSEIFSRGSFTEEGKALHDSVRKLQDGFVKAFDAKKKRLEKEARERRMKEFDL